MYSMSPSHQPHPDEWEQDVPPDFFVGISSEREAPYEEGAMLTAYEIPSLRRRLFGFCNAELKQIPVLPEWRLLEQGATYLDLIERPPREFTAPAEMAIAADHFYVPKSQVPEELWNRLLGRHKPDDLWTHLTGGDEPDRPNPSNLQSPGAERMGRAGGAD